MRFSPNSCERSGERDEKPLDRNVKNSETALLRGASLQTPGFPGEMEGPLPSESADPLPPWVLGKKSGLFFFSLHAEQGGTQGLAGFVLLLQGSSWALLQSSPGCFGWFGGKRWRLHHLNQTGGPLVANVGEKLATEGKACPERPARLTAGLLGGPGAPRTALNG